MLRLQAAARRATAVPARSAWWWSKSAPPAPAPAGAAAPSAAAAAPPSPGDAVPAAAGQPSYVVTELPGVSAAQQLRRVVAAKRGVLGHTKKLNPLAKQVRRASQSKSERPSSAGDSF